jgi:hypothetical protein
MLSSISNFNIDLRYPLSPKKKDNSISNPGKFKNDHTSLTNILKPEQLIQRPVSIKRPGL